jgi:hypothetical protein
MSQAREEPQFEPGPLESETMTVSEHLAALEARLAVLEAKRIRRRPDTNRGRCRTRLSRSDRTPFGWKTSTRDPSVLVQDVFEQQTIQRVIELAQVPAHGPRVICRILDSLGLKRRGKRWTGAHSLIKSILAREGISTASDAERLVRSRCFKPAVAEPPSGTSEAEAGNSVQA